MEREEFYAAVCKTENELKHHGIIGQKWGEKNGPPYPLDSKQHSSAEKKDNTSKKKTKTTLKEKIQKKDEQLTEALKKKD
jgi:hypothetical protein